MEALVNTIDSIVKVA